MTSQSGLPSEFGVVSSITGFEVILKVRGEVDVRTAPELNVVLNESIDGGHRFVVLDLSDLDFMDGSGLHVIAKGAERLASSGGALTIRSPSVTLCRLLDIVGLTTLVRIEQPKVASGPLGSEQVIELTEALAQVAGLGQTRHLRMVTAFPTDDQLVDGTLRLVVALAQATVGGADGVSVSLRRRGVLSTVAATDQTISDMDANQYATGEGPCIDASVEGRWFHAASLEAEERWPAFTPRARELGINGILSSPLMARDEPIGALNIYSRTVSAFTPKDQELAAVFAAEASTVLTDVGVHVTDEQLASRFQGALRTRELIAQAQGVIMERRGLAEEAAYSVLRRLSLENGRPLRDRAEEVVNSARRPQPDPATRNSPGHHE